VADSCPTYEWRDRAVAPLLLPLATRLQSLS